MPNRCHGDHECEWVTRIDVRVSFSVPATDSFAFTTVSSLRVAELFTGTPLLLSRVSESVCSKVGVVLEIGEAFRLPGYSGLLNGLEGHLNW